MEVPELDLKLRNEIQVTDIIPLDELDQILGPRKQELSKMLFDKLVIVKSSEKYHIELRMDFTPLSEDMQEYRQEQFD